MTRKLNVAIVGATGLVGKTLLTVLEERSFPIDTLYPIASERSLGETVTFNGQTLDVIALPQFNFADADIAFFAAGETVSGDYAPIAAEAGCVVIDKSATFRYDDDVPLVIPEVNPDSIANYTKRGIIANPNCSTVQMAVALKPLQDAYGIERINVATYQSVSGTGRDAVDELIHQSTELLNGHPITPKVYPQQIAFNVLPHVDSFQDNGYTREEMKMVWETQKILEDESILINPTTVRVPVLYAHSEALHIELKSSFNIDDVKNLYQEAAGIQLVDDPAKGLYPTPIENAIGSDDVFVGRVREDITHPRGLNIWVVSDNIRKGAATNAVQVAEILQQVYL